MRPTTRRTVVTLALLACAPLTLRAELQSAGALEFGPGGTLFVADSRGGAVYAVETGLPSQGSSEEREGVRDLDAKLAALLGVDVREVFIKDLAVHRPSGTTVLSIMRGSGEAVKPVLMTVSRAGEIK